MLCIVLKDSIFNEEKKECEHLINRYLSDTISEFKLSISKNKIELL